MNEFKIEYKRQSGYDQHVEVDIRLLKRPSKEDYQKILDAIDTLSIIADTYIQAPEKKAVSK